MVLLKHILCMLHHIQMQSEQNKMTSSNLAICIAPSMISKKDCLNLSSGAPALEILIDNCVDIFGPEVLQLLEEPKSRPDSGTDSDSYHSVLSMPETGNSDSIDSLVERELYAQESSPTLVKSHLSPNVSRDSGLTLGDTQLYKDDIVEHGDHRHGPRLFHRSAPHFPERDDYESDFHQDAANMPVPPPRKRGKRQSMTSGGDHTNRAEYGGSSGGGGMSGRDKRHTLHSSVSSSQLLDHLPRQLSSGSATTHSLRPTLTHPSFSYMYDQAGIDRQDLSEYKKPADMGMLRKSASGAHLILDDETLPRKRSDSGISGIVFRQRSAADSTPPLSPQSKYSRSFLYSCISDMSYGFTSSESSLASAPQTPDADHLDRRPPWLPSVGMEQAGDCRLTRSFSVAAQRGGLHGSEDSMALAASYSGPSHLHSMHHTARLHLPAILSCVRV